MGIKLNDEYVESDEIFGPIPNFNEPFEKFFIKKSFDLLLSESVKGLKKHRDSDCLDSNSNEPEEYLYVTIRDTRDLSWMFAIELAKSSRLQNIEIIYNNNKVYYKAIKKIYKDDILCAFPSKDLEISLGLQFIPINSDDKYVCKKCSQIFNYQYNLMLHARYFCSFNQKNLIKNIQASINYNSIQQNDNENFDNQSDKSAEIMDNSKKNLKRKLTETLYNNFNAPKKRNKNSIDEENKYDSVSQSDEEKSSNAVPNDSRLQDESNNYSKTWLNFFKQVIHTPNIGNQQANTNIKVIQSFMDNILKNGYSMNGQLGPFQPNNFNELVKRYEDQNNFLISQSKMKTNLSQPYNYGHLAGYFQASKDYSTSYGRGFGSFENQPSLIQDSNVISPIPKNDFKRNYELNINPLNENISVQASDQLVMQQNTIKKEKLVMYACPASNHSENSDEGSNSLSTVSSPNQAFKLKAGELSSVINTQTQNWCAKCNTSFRLTSDLVYHMRTFHRKEGSTATLPKSNSKFSFDFYKPASSSQNDLQNGSDTLSRTNQREIKYLRCEICNEIFKRKASLIKTHDFT